MAMQTERITISSKVVPKNVGCAKLSFKICNQMTTKFWAIYREKGNRSKRNIGETSEVASKKLKM